MNLIDAHCHLTYEQFGDIEAVLQRSRDAGITGWITIGTDVEESGKAVELTGRFENMFATAAIHPHEAKSADQSAMAQIKELAKNNKVVAIGETGLDFHYEFSTKEQQRESFIKHLEMAAELNLPVVIHSREAFDETVEILEKHKGQLKGVVFHCFSGSVEQAKMVLEKGWFISLTGVVTFKNANKTREVAKLVPLERLMIETDAPYLSPEPMRKLKVNEPAFLIHTAKFIAGLRGMELANFADKVTATTKQFFGLPDLI
ncbi:MAG: TatD family hydrolase [Sedimentisphaerales bacterium]|nr:TatD family hydrolase [Sedimentisphaerales bacterium]